MQKGLPAPSFSIAHSIFFIGCMYCAHMSSKVLKFEEKVARLPHSPLLIARQPLGEFSSNLAHVMVCSSPGKNILNDYGVMTFQPTREIT